MSSSRDIESLNRNELLEFVKQLVAQSEQLREIIKKQQEEIDRLKRGGKRQATPFSKGTRTKNERGSRAFEAFTSVTRTMTRAGGSVIDGLVDLFRSAKLQGASP